MKYHISIRTIHWIMALIMAGLLISGLTVDMWRKDAKPLFYYWHKSLGMIILGLVAVRLFCRIYFLKPGYPAKLKHVEMIIAKSTVHSFYLLLFLMPISGYVMSVAGGHDVAIFGLQLPKLIAEDKPLGRLAYEAHEIMANAFLALIALHVAGVIKHFVFDKENLLKRMW